MKNEDYEQILEGYNNQLRHWDAKKKVINDMIRDLGMQYNTACEEWDGVWRERQAYINDHEEELAASK